MTHPASSPHRVEHAQSADVLARQQRRWREQMQADAVEAEPFWLRRLGTRAPRLDVYHHAYRARLLAALRSNYPVLPRAMGDEAFDDLALQYLAAHPSREPSIRWFGHALPAWLVADPDRLPHPALADLAAMEWALGTSFDAQDRTPLAFADLAAQPAEAWPGLRFEAHPSVALLALQWAVEPLWRALTHDADAATDEPEPHAHRLLVWRQGLDTQWRSLPDDEAALLAACLAGGSFMDLCEQAAVTQGEGASAWVASALRRWVDDGLLCAPAVNPGAGA